MFPHTQGAANQLEGDPCAGLGVSCLPGLIRGSRGAGVHKQTRSEQQLIGLGGLEDLSLVGGKSPELHKGVEPDEVERGEIGDQRTHALPAPGEVAGGAELVVDEPAGQLGGGSAGHQERRDFGRETRKSGDRSKMERGYRKFGNPGQGPVCTRDFCLRRFEIASTIRNSTESVCSSAACPALPDFPPGLSFPDSV